MKKAITLAAVLSICLTLMSPISQSNENRFGLGVITGEPTGISWKKWIDNDSAYDAAAAWSFTEQASIHIHADWLKHNWKFLKQKTDITSGELPLYYGVGGRVKIEDDSSIGIRFVIGVSYIVENEPFDVFCEIAPIVDVIPETKLGGNIGLGVRIWF
ncbi:hypothetical protein ACFL1R_03700 [Candidatus Latescibacterota bacterium]